MLAAVIACLTQLPPTNDAAWQIWVGRQLLGGARLYHDIIEINPPLWFWIGAPISPLGWPGLLIFFGLASAVSMVLASRLYRFWWLPYALIFTFFLTGISATGQREQFTLIAVTPYVLLTAARAEGRRISLSLAVAVGLWAAPGFALKHYFALVPLALQAWLMLRRRPITPEFVAICVVGAAYIAAILIFIPEYLTGIVPIIHEAYGAYDQKLSWFLTTDIILIGIVAAIGFHLADRRDAVARALAISAAVFLCIYVVQLKGFRYHAQPALGLLSLMALLLLSQLDFSSLRSRAAGAVLIFVPIFTVNGGALFPPQSKTAEFLCTLPPGTKVLAVAVNGRNAWPAVERCNLVWLSRQMVFWTLSSPKMDQFTSAEILHDLATMPDVVVIDKRPSRASPYKFVRSNARIMAALRSYRVIVENGDLVVLELRAVRSSRSKDLNVPPSPPEQ